MAANPRDPQKGLSYVYHLKNILPPIIILEGEFVEEFSAY